MLLSISINIIMHRRRLMVTTKKNPVTDTTTKTKTHCYITFFQKCKWKIRRRNKRKTIEKRPQNIKINHCINNDNRCIRIKFSIYKAKNGWIKFERGQIYVTEDLLQETYPLSMAAEVMDPREVTAGTSLKQYIS